MNDVLRKRFCLCALACALVAACNGAGGGAEIVQPASVASASITIDAATVTGAIDLTPYALGQGGLSSLPMIDGEVDDLRALAPATIRVFLQEYFAMYPAHGTYDWTRLDRFLDAVVATGAQPIANIDFKPPVLYPVIDQTIVEPTSWDEWENLISELVKHCQSRGYRIRYWEIGNEGDIGESGGCPYRFTPDNYVTYYQHTASAIRRADPTARVGGPALANVYDPIGHAIIAAAGSGAVPLDFFSWHGYSSDVGSFRSAIRSVRGRLAQYPSLAATETLISEWNVDLESPNLDPHFQPAFILEMTRMFAEEQLSRAAYYHIHDVHVDESEFDRFMSAGGASAMAAWWNVHPQYDGIWDYAGNRRAAYDALAFTGALAGSRVAVAGETGEVRALGARVGSALRAAVWSYPGSGDSYDVTVQLPGVAAAGAFSVERLAVTATSGQRVAVRSGSTSELASDPIVLHIAPFEIYFVTAALDDAATSTSLFGGQTPALTDWSDGAPHELGVKIRAASAGRVTALRFYNTPSESGAHVGHLWTADGVELARASFADGLAAGWQEVALPAPVTLAPGVEYVVSVNSNVSYVATVGGLSQVTAHGALASVADGANGVYGGPGTFPAQTFASANYFRDVVFASP